MSDVAVHPETQLPSHARRIFILVGIVLVALAAAYWARYTESGQAIASRENITGWVQAHPMIAPVAFFAFYVLLILLALPIWWLQIVAGVCFGIWWGVLICTVGSTLGAAIAARLSGWCSEDSCQQKIEGGMTRVKKLRDKLGHNGFLLVLACRMIYGLPFSITNYALGILGIPMRSIIAGTLVGVVPSVALYVAMGIDNPLNRPWMLGTIIGLNVLVLSIIPLRYLKPQWFRKMGIE